jgi:TetR/AcrR family transcriptional repressor of lmrAB and yxaGH operons
VLASGGASGCVVAGVSLDSGADDGGESLISVARETFRSWVDVLAGQLAEAGVPARQASSIAVATLAAMEGALILCRAEGDVGPLEETAAELMRLLPPTPSAPPDR